MGERIIGPTHRLEAAGGKNILVVSEGLLESYWEPGCVVDVADAQDAVRVAELATDGGPVPMLSEMTDVVITPAARHVFARASHVSAIAVLGSSVVDRVLAAAMNRHTEYPHRFFMSRSDAESWLRSHLPVAEDLTESPE
jgi:hypothetical protein